MYTSPLRGCRALLCCLNSVTRVDLVLEAQRKKLSLFLFRLGIVEASLRGLAMAIIAEEHGEQEPKPQQLRKRPTNPPKTKTKPSTTSSTSTPNEPQNPFSFWFYFTISVSLVTLLFLSFSSLSPQDTKSWFLGLPATLRQHYSKGRTIKVHTLPNQAPTEVFTVEEGPIASENVIIVHGFGLSSYSYRQLSKSLAAKGVHAVALDLPGNGFSDKYTEEIVEGEVGILGRFRYVYSEIKEKGFFWAFDQIVETGQIPYEEILARMSKRKVLKPIELGPEEIGRVLGQIVDTMRLAPVHLVLHDSALGLSANWISDNSEVVRSVTLIDTSMKTSGALPSWVLDVPVIREIVLGSSFVYGKMLNLCCSKRLGMVDADAHRVLLKGRDGRRSAVAMGKNVNNSFDVAEWGGSDGLKHMPMQVIWSDGWSQEWSEEGDRIAQALPSASFVTHSGGRWAQEDVAVELADKISQFVSSLPKTVRKVQEEPIPEHIQKMFDVAKGSDHHDHDHHHHGHEHYGGHGAGYDAYGLGGGW